LRRTKQERSFKSIRIIGEQWNPRSHALRDILERRTDPFGFNDCESEEGRRILAHLTHLPARNNPRAETESGWNKVSKS